MNFFLRSLVAFLPFLSNAQAPTNFNFEELFRGHFVDVSHHETIEYRLTADSLVKHEGKYAAKLEYVGGEKSFDAISFYLPPNLSGKKIKFSAFIKTENVTEGYAGLWLRIDPNIGFDNMGNRGLKGTNDWQKLEIEMDMYSDLAINYVVGALLEGKGKMWVDQFEVTIDGVPYSEAKKINYPADEDHRFDQGSTVDLQNLNKSQLDNLELLGKIWGFLKYHHPAIAAGKYNWDYELLAFLPQYMAVKSPEERNDLLFTWINKLGDFETVKAYPKPAKNTTLTPDFSWITSSHLDAKCIDLFEQIKRAKRNDKHYYLVLPNGEYIPTIKEKTTPQQYPDAGFRLLSLFRYWSIIEYFSPYKDLSLHPWSELLKTYIPIYLNASDEAAYVTAVKQFATETHDSHTTVNGTTLSGYPNGKNCANVFVRFIENQSVVVGKYNKDLSNGGIQNGDVILAINGRTIEDIKSQFAPVLPTSNAATFMRDVNRKMMYTHDSTLLIKLKRNEEIISLTVPTYDVEALNQYSIYEGTKPALKLLNSTTVYINVGSLQVNDLIVLDSLLETTRNLIIDSRNYPSDFILYGLGELLQKKRIPFYAVSGTSLQFPGIFYQQNENYVGKKGGKGFTGNIVVLVNELTQSSAEFHVMSFQAHPNTRVIGSTTAGADGNVVDVYLPGNLITHFATIGIYYPDGTPTQQVGIRIDEVVRPTIAGIQQGKDELLERAIELLGTK